MRALHPASAGTLESSDCLIEVLPGETEECVINVDSVVYEQYGSEIFEVVTNAVRNMNLTHSIIEVHDRGAYNCAIEARLETAVMRSLQSEVAR